MVDTVQDNLRVVRVGAGSSHSGALLSDEQSTFVVTFGRGEDGQLGHGDAEEQHEPRVVATLSDRSVEALSCGAEYTVALCSNGSEAFSWGWGDFGRLGHGDCSDVFIPRRIECLSQRGVQAITCGDAHTLAILHSGALLAFGRNQNGQLGDGTQHDRLVATPVTGLAEERVVGAAAGAEHSVCVTAAGRVFAWGWNQYGNLGIGTTDDIAAPRKMSGLDGVDAKVVACGWRHSMIIDAGGLLRTCGWSKYGQLGHGDLETAAVPKVVERLRDEPVLRVDGGWRHSIAATATTFYAWGWNKFGQLGLPAVQVQSTPTPIDALSRPGMQVVEMSCGWKHTVAVTNSGEFFAMGRGTNGQLGRSVRSDVFEPMRVSKLCQGSIEVDVAPESAADSGARMFVPACDRYALVPGGDHSAVVPDAGADGDAARKRIRTA